MSDKAHGPLGYHNEYIVHHRIIITFNLNNIKVHVLFLPGEPLRAFRYLIVPGHMFFTGERI